VAPNLAITLSNPVSRKEAMAVDIQRRKFHERVITLQNPAIIAAESLKNRGWSEQN
jgi:hypothetical protein